MKYLTLHETTAAYEAAASNFELPHVALTKDDMSVHYQPYVEPQIPNNTIIYNASAKLTETTSDKNAGLHTNTFSGTSGQLTITNHTFENGVGTIEFNGDVIDIGKGAFYSCTAITEITIPNSVISFSKNNYSSSEGSFYHCISLIRLNSDVDGVFNIPSGVTSIGNNTFHDCTSLTSINIPSGVTSIGDYTFYDCNSLTSITCNATTAPTIQSTTFQSVKTGGTLYVPQGSSGYDVWMGTGNYYLGLYNWTKVEQ